MKKLLNCIKKHKKIYILSLAILLLISTATVGIVVLVQKERSEESVATGYTSDKIYCNVDGSTYISKDSGLSLRPKAKDGFYKVLFSVEGEQVEFNVEDRGLLQKIDKKTIMGLEFDENGTVVGCLEPYEVGGGALVNMFFATSVSEDTVVLNGMADGSGYNVEVPINKESKIWDVSLVAEVKGAAGTVEPEDTVSVYLDKQGEISEIFILYKSLMFDGEVVRDYCEHCDKNVLWGLWTDGNSVPVQRGHYRLTTDIKLFGEQNAIGQGQKIILDLNGKTVQGPEGKRLYTTFYEGGYLAVVDSSEGQTGKMVAKTRYTGNGAIMWVRYGTFELYSGTLDVSECSTEGNGTAVSVGEGSTFNMYGGTIIGGLAYSGPRSNGRGNGGSFGGSVSVGKSAVFNMYGGTIRDGVSISYLSETSGNLLGGSGGNIYIDTGGTMNFHGGSVLNGKAAHVGGNIMLNSTNSTLNIYDGAVISGGQLTKTGRNSGNVHVGLGAVVNMKGGEIKNGMATSAGGNVTNYGTFTMSGGKITGGTIKTGKDMNSLQVVESATANIHCLNAEFVMTGGYIDGGVRFANSGQNKDGTDKVCKVKLSGSAQIHGGAKNVSLDGTTVLNLGKMNKNAKISMSTGGYVSDKTEQVNLTYVVHESTEVDSHYINEKIFLGRVSCVCGGNEGKHYGACDGSSLEWLPWPNKSSIPLSDENWYLIHDIQLQANSNINIAAGATLRLDLNGHAIHGVQNQRVYQVSNAKSEFVLTDNSEKRDGRIVAYGDKNCTFGGMCLRLCGAKTKTSMYGGVLDASQVLTMGDGPALRVQAGDTFTMYGGTIQGGASILNEKGTSGGLAGAVSVYGVFDMHAGTIQGGKAGLNGGNLWIDAEGQFNMYGGLIHKGSADNMGGNIMCYGQMTMWDNALIESGYAGGVQNTGDKNPRKIGGGNICVGQLLKKNVPMNGTLVINGGTIKNGSTNVNGGNVALIGSCVMNEGLILDGQAKLNAATNNIYAYQAVNGDYHDYIRLCGGEIRGGIGFSGNILEMLLSGNIRILGSKEGYASGLTIPKGNTVTVGDLKSGASIAVTGYQTIATDAIATDAACFVLDEGAKELDASQAVHYTTKTLVVGVGGVAGSCLCGKAETDGDASKCIGACDGTWLVWTPTDKLPTTAGNWRLVADVDATNVALAKKQTVNLDLNGRTVTNRYDVNGDGVIEDGEQTENSRRLFGMYTNAGKNTVETSFNIVDHHGAGNVTLYGQGTNGVVGWIGGGSNQMSIYGGTFDATKITNSSAQGILFHLYQHADNEQDGYEQGKLYLHGGTLKGGTTTKEGGAVYCNAYMQMTGGTISGGTAQDGGNIYVGSSGTLNMSGGIISDGNANLGGNLKPNGTVTISGGSVQKGTAKRGGNIDITSGLLTISGGSIVEGKATGTTGGGCIAVRDNATVNMSGGTISSGSTSYEGGNVYLTGENSNFTMSGGTIENGTARGGGNVWIAATGNMTMSGGSITGGIKAGDKTGNEYKYSSNMCILGTVRLTGGTIAGGIYNKKTGTVVTGNIQIGKDSSGSGLFIQQSYTVNLSGLTGKIYVNGWIKAATGCSGFTQDNLSTYVEADDNRKASTYKNLILDGDMLYIGSTK